MDSRASIENEPHAGGMEIPATSEQTIASEGRMGSSLAENPLQGWMWQILLVEDEAFVRRVTAEVLEAAGYRLLIAENAAEAMKICRQGSTPLHLLLSDVVLPGKNGRELARECRALYPMIGVLLVSGYAEQLATSEAVDDGGHEYLAKPFSTHTLLRKVREVLEGTSQRNGVS